MATNSAITKTALRRLMKNEAGAQIVAADAVKYLLEQINDIAIDITKKALELAQHAKRKTIQRKDIKIAIEAI